MLLDIAIVSLILGWVFRGRLANLAEVEIRGLVLALLVVVVQYGRRYAADSGWIALRTWGPLVYVGTFLLLMTVIWLNRRSPALLLMGTGILLNLLVIAANEARCPSPPTD